MLPTPPLFVVSIIQKNNAQNTHPPTCLQWGRGVVDLGYMAKSIRQLRGEYTQLLEAMNDNLRKQIDVLVSTPSALGQGAVYVVRQVGTNNYKIGHTTNYDQRKYQFDVSLPFEIEEVFVYRTPNYRALELVIHDLLKPHRLNRSEFFELDKAQVDALVEVMSSEDAKLTDALNSRQNTPTEEMQLDQEELDEALYEEAQSVVIEEGRASTSFLQRRLKVGYSRAARIVDQLEKNGIIGRADGSKPRQIIATTNSK